jgi:phosphate transport system substrate-binding protein
VAVLAVLAVAGTSCRSSPARLPDVRIAGSDTMLPLNRRLAQAFMREHAGVAVRVDGGSTGFGVRALLDESVDLCAASRPFRPAEVNALYETFGTMGLRFLIARDALTILVHPDNPVRSLTMDDLAAVFSGRIASWTEVGGVDAPIEVVLRPSSSGTYHFFRDHVFAGDDYTDNAETVSRAVDVDELISRSLHAISFGGLRDAGVKRLDVDGVTASIETVRRGEYPLSRYLYFYATAPPTGHSRTFLEWCVSADGQRVVEEAGFVPLWIEN